MNWLAANAELSKNKGGIKDPCFLDLISKIENQWNYNRYLTDEEIGQAAKRLVESCLGEEKDNVSYERSKG
jgi:hypothetical protein